MSSNVQSAHADHKSADQGCNHAHGHDRASHSHATLASYTIGFILSVILTAIPFYLVMSGAIANKTITAVLIMAFAVVQIFVHMIYFLHMNTKSEGGWSILALLFTLVLVVITLSGSLWVMYHLNMNMMPGLMNPHDMG